jgi:hypothetical protein
MGTKFTRDDLRPGYIVKLGNDQLRQVVEIGKKGSYILIAANGDWGYLSHWNYDLTANVYMLADPYTKKGRELLKSFHIVEVYGFVTDTAYYHFSNQIATVGRDLLWSKTPTVKMTVSEIEEKLGHKIEIVAEEE